MIKTKNGNDQMSYEEFKNELLNFNPIINDEHAQITYNELSKMLIYNINEVKTGYDYDWAMHYIKKEMRKYFKALYVSLGYDAGRYDLVPQDMPYKLLLLDTRDGEVYTLGYIRMKIEEERKCAKQ